jgi:Pregnancy-associated plasma protein-A
MPHHYFLAETDPVYRDNRRIIESNTRTARLATRTSVIRIPVVVHVLFHADQENLEMSQIESQIAALNRDYRMQNADRSQIPDPFRIFAADTLIEFGLAVRDPQGNVTTGVTRTRTSKTVFPYDPNDRQATKKLDDMIKFDGFGKAAWPRDSYLNLWTCNLGGGLLGYAQFPGGAPATDGVVIRNRAFGSNGIAAAPYNLGRTAVHEVGHWLNLLHIWGDDDGGCSASDMVDDTPNQAGSNGSEVRISNFPHITCNNGPNGDMFMNYMDYVDEDTMFMFTAGQLKRMNATLAGPRASLSSSMGLTPVHTPAIEREAVALVASDTRSILGDERGERPTLGFDGVSWSKTSDRKLALTEGVPWLSRSTSICCTGDGCTRAKRIRPPNKSIGRPAFLFLLHVGAPACNSTKMERSSELGSARLTSPM